MARTTSKQGILLIKKFEGCRLSAYQDAVGVTTIGYGWTKAIDGKPLTMQSKITQEKADALLTEGLASFEAHVNAYDPTYHWNQNQFDALVSFAYNIGSINQLTANGTRSIPEIAQKITAYSKAGGKTLPGLKRRREEEKALFQAPVPAPKKDKAERALVTYQSHRIPDNRWGHEITGCNATDSMGYSGVIGKAIDKIAVKVSQGSVTYLAHRTDGNWGKEITGFSTTDTNRYAGSGGKPIDAVAVKADGINGRLSYRAHRKAEGKWGNWITGYSKTDANRYAGIFGREIDAIQIRIE